MTYAVGSLVHSPMTPLTETPAKRNGPASEAEAIFTLCLLAAFADGAKEARERVALIDWDEAHVDVPDLDLVLPGNAGDLDADRYDVASQASAAWEAAVCWDDDYARSQLAQVRPV